MLSSSFTKRLHKDSTFTEWLMSFTRGIYEFLVQPCSSVSNQYAPFDLVIDITQCQHSVNLFKKKTFKVLNLRRIELFATLNPVLCTTLPQTSVAFFHSLHLQLFHLKRITSTESNNTNCLLSSLY